MEHVTDNKQITIQYNLHLGVFVMFLFVDFFLILFVIFYFVFRKWLLILLLVTGWSTKQAFFPGNVISHVYHEAVYSELRRRCCCSVSADIKLRVISFITPHSWCEGSLSHIHIVAPMIAWQDSHQTIKMAVGSVGRRNIKTIMYYAYHHDSKN